MAAALAGASAQAADIDGFATVSQFQYELIDLNLNDNIAPSIQFHDATFYARSSGESWSGSPEVHSIGTAGSVDSSGPDGASRALTSSGGVASSARIDARADSSQLYQGEASYASAFTLSASTGVRFTALAQIGIDNPDDVYARSRLSLEGSLDAQPGTIFDSQSFKNEYETRHGSGTYHLAGYLYSDQLARDGVLTLRASTAVFGAAQPVPEPATWGMLAAGALVVLARRRGQTR